MQAKGVHQDPNDQNNREPEEDSLDWDDISGSGGDAIGELNFSEEVGPGDDGCGAGEIDPDYGGDEGSDHLLDDP